MILHDFISSNSENKTMPSATTNLKDQNPYEGKLKVISVAIDLS